MGPRALAFDVFGTVVDWRSSVIRQLEEFGQRHGLQQDWPSFADNWRAGYAPAMDRVRRGELPWTRIDDLHRMILEEHLGAAGITSICVEDVDDAQAASLFGSGVARLVEALESLANGGVKGRLDLQP